MDIIDIVAVIFIVVFFVPLTGLVVSVPIYYLALLFTKLFEQSLVWTDVWVEKYGQSKASYAYFFIIGCVVWILMYLLGVNT